MKENKELLYKAFANIFTVLFENESDNMELTFDFKGLKAKFKVELVELEHLTAEDISIFN